MSVLPADQLNSLRRLISTLSVTSSFLAFLVVITYAVFEEKRKTSTSIIVYLQAVMALGLDLAFIIPGFFGDQLSPESGHVALCHFQAWCFLYFGVAVQCAWFFVTLNLFRRVYQDRPELGIKMPLAVIVLLPVVTSVVPFLTDSVVNDGVWCFIDSFQPEVLYTCFYNILIIVTFAGTPLWITIIWKMTQSLWNERKHNKRQAASTSSHGENSNATIPATGVINEQKPLIYAESTQMVGYHQKIMLLFRQVVYVTGFLIIFYVMLTNRIILSVRKETTYAGWMIHASAIGILGTYIFFVFGFTERNIYLWKSYLSSVKTVPSGQVPYPRNVNYQSVS